MITLRQSPFDLFERLDQQLSQVERVPAAEIHETDDHYSIRLELPGVAHDSIDVKASDRSLSVSAERRNPQAVADAEAGASADNTLLSEFRYGNWSRSFRFAHSLDRDALRATYRDGILTIEAPKTDNRTTVSVKVDS
ncbi:MULTISPECIES: Hsp20/alpha crystallin family protein [unclassified Synechococcus]|uniref:Hsp20/alpha crystallin family protein n=1 Tax=unclassified Synechococcus TaxID=2626047 RepID=UPI0039AFFD00